MTIMLTSDALNYLSNTMQQCKPYGDSIQELRKFYTSNEKRTGLLTAWQSITFSKSMAESPDLLEVAVFRSFVAKLMTQQRQLYPQYHSDMFFRDRLIMTSLRSKQLIRIGLHARAIIQSTAFITSFLTARVPLEVP